MQLLEEEENDATTTMGETFEPSADATAMSGMGSEAGFAPRFPSYRPPSKIIASPATTSSSRTLSFHSLFRLLLDSGQWKLCHFYFGWKHGKSHKSLGCPASYRPTSHCFELTRFILLYIAPHFTELHSHPQNVWDGHFNKLHTARNAVLNSRFKFDIDWDGGEFEEKVQIYKGASQCKDSLLKSSWRC